VTGVIGQCWGLFPSVAGILPACLRHLGAIFPQPREINLTINLDGSRYLYNGAAKLLLMVQPLKHRQSDSGWMLLLYRISILTRKAPSSHKAVGLGWKHRIINTDWTDLVVVLKRFAEFEQSDVVALIVFIFEVCRMFHYALYLRVSYRRLICLQILDSHRQPNLICVQFWFSVRTRWKPTQTHPYTKWWWWRWHYIDTFVQCVRKKFTVLPAFWITSTNSEPVS